MIINKLHISNNLRKIPPQAAMNSQNLNNLANCNGLKGSISNDDRTTKHDNNSNSKQENIMQKNTQQNVPKFIEFDDIYDFSKFECECIESIPIYYQEILSSPHSQSDILSQEKDTAPIKPCSDDSIYISKLFDKYKFSEFTCRKSLVSSFSNINKQLSMHWNIFLNRLVSYNVLSSKKVGNDTLYRFNIKSEKNNSYMTYDCVLYFLRRWYDKDEKIEFNTSSSRSKFSGVVAPEFKNWELFLDTLVKENILKTIGILKNNKVYSFKTD